MSEKDLVELKEKNINVYDLLEILNSASENEIKKSYRKKALIYHPDKNTSREAVEKFHLIKLALNILLDKSHRSNYDNWLNAIQAQVERTKELSNTRKRMLDELERSEKLANKASTWNKRRANKSTDTFGIDIEKLREEGMLLRKKLQQKRDQKSQGTQKDQPSASSNLTPNNSTNIDQTYSVIINWKVKQGISLTTDILESIMSVFGPVLSVKPTQSDNKYAAAITTYSNEQSYLKATSYDVSREKSKAWEGTSYRKLSSLLRDIKPLDSDLEKDELYDFMIETLEKLKDFKRTN